MTDDSITGWVIKEPTRREKRSRWTDWDRLVMQRYGETPELWEQRHQRSLAFLRAFRTSGHISVEYIGG